MKNQAGFSQAKNSPHAILEVAKAFYGTHAPPQFAPLGRHLRSLGGTIVAIEELDFLERTFPSIFSHPCPLCGTSKSRIKWHHVYYQVYGDNGKPKGILRVVPYFNLDLVVMYSAPVFTICTSGRHKLAGMRCGDLSGVGNVLFELMDDNTWRRAFEAEYAVAAD
ncbi:MAG: hypothetical protein G01um101470_624 [Parcubacteria group bacterium Gr01-1014_70]|nr:MAG: hypothetical protein G01um101470_624 [Parcubacteria group bacterium Gr01-1014_70]